MPATALSEGSLILAAAGILLIPFAAAGLALVNTGFGRSRSAAHAMLGAMCVAASAALAYFVVGFSVEGFSVRHLFMRGLVFDGSTTSLAACLQLFAVGVAAIIPLGAASERWRLGASCLSAALLGAISYPILGHWLWAGGWLAQLGAVDCGGAAVIQATGGLTALAITWILGPRHGKYEASGMAIPGHNLVMVLFGCFFCAIGFLGLNTAGAIVFAGAAPAAVPLIAINLTLASAASLLTALAVTRVRYHKPDASITANGFVIGLVAISAGSSLLSPPEAAAIGLIAGLLVPFSVEWLDRLGFDDPSGVISVHGLGAIWGLLATGVLAQGHTGLALAQLAVVSALLGFTLPAAYLLNAALNRFRPMRVDREAERRGMDMHEFGAGAYPELAQAMKEQFFR
jgi:Amt family ammonium transporter